MVIAAYAAVIALSLLLAISSRRHTLDPRAFFTASGQLGWLLVFFLAVGETYSVASMLGYPGGVFARGEGVGAWFFGYILLVAPILFFVGPWIARAGRLYDAATIADVFARHYASRALEVAIALVAIAALVPVGTMQFLGLRIVFATLAPDAPPLMLAIGAALIAFVYVAIAGLRTSAFVAVLKDLLMIGSILLVSGLALGHWRAGPPVVAVAAAPILPRDLRFALTTILVQSLGFVMLPQSWSLLFAARSPDAIRRAQAVAPLYMIMFPLLMIVATYALRHRFHPRAPDHVFLDVAAALLPAPLLGIVLAGVTLAGLVLLTTVCLSIGSLVTRNLSAGLDGGGQRRGAKMVTFVYLLLSIAFAEAPGRLMTTMNNLTYHLIVQLLPALAAAFWLGRVPPAALIGGMAAGGTVAIGLFAAGTDVGGINPGLIGVAANLLVVGLATLARPRTGGETIVTRLAGRDAAADLA